MINPLSGAGAKKVCKYFRFCQKLSKEYVLAKISADPAEDELLKFWRRFIRFTLSSP